MSKLHIILLLLFLISGCGKTHSKLVDRTAEVYAQVRETMFEMDSSSFQFTAPGRFNLSYDVHVFQGPMFFSDKGARCVFKLEGSIYIHDASPSAPSSIKYQAEGKIEKAFLASSLPIYSPNNFTQICKAYQSALIQKPDFQFGIFEVSPDYIAFSSIDLPILSEKKEEQFRTELHSLRVPDFSIKREGYSYKFFLKKDALLNITDFILRDIGGTHQSSDSKEVSMLINPQNKSLTFSSSVCGFKYSFDVLKIFMSSQRLWANLRLASNTANTSDSLDCKKWSENIVGLSQLEFGYSFGAGRNFTFLRLPSSNQGYDRVTTFEKIR